MGRSTVKCNRESGLKMIHYAGHLDRQPFRVLLYDYSDEDADIYRKVNAMSIKEDRPAFSTKPVKPCMSWTGMILLHTLKLLNLRRGRSASRVVKNVNEG